MSEAKRRLNIILCHVRVDCDAVGVCADENGMNARLENLVNFASDGNLLCCLG
jgi:hypothetical protein